MMFRDKRLNKEKTEQWDRAAKRITQQSVRELISAGEPQSIPIWIQNDSGAARDLGEVLGVGAPLFSMSTQGTEDLIFSGITFNTAAQNNQWRQPCVLLEPIPSGEVGRACIAGVCLAWVEKGANTSIRTARIDTGLSLYTLTTGGPIRLLGDVSVSAKTLLPVLLSAAPVRFRYQLKETVDANTAAWSAINRIDGSVQESPFAFVHFNFSALTGFQPGYQGECVFENGRFWHVYGPASTPPNTAGSITPPGIRTATVGTPLSFALTSSGLSSAMSATGLPPGITLSGSTISGTPTTAGNYYAVVTATAPLIPSGSTTITRIVAIYVS